MKQFSRSKRAEQVEKLFTRYSCRYDYSIASTNSRYYSVTAPDGEEITVRVADHCDAYCRTTFTVDPAFDQYPAVVEWVEAHGEKKAVERSLRYCWIKENKCSLPVTTKAEALANPVEGGVLHYLNKGTCGWKPVE